MFEILFYKLLITYYKSIKGLHLPFEQIINVEIQYDMLIHFDQTSDEQ